jgi:integrase
MASLFRPIISRYTLPNGSARTPDGQRVNKDTPGARRKKSKAKKWYGQYADANGQTQRVPLSPNKTVAQQMLAALVNKNENAKIGRVDRFEEHHKRPLAEHLGDFHKELSSRDNAPRYVEMVVSRLRSLLDGCGFVFISDQSASRAADWLAGLRRQARPRLDLPPDQEWFTLREAAAVLGGVKPASVSAAVRRNRLEAEGNGKARRLPRATVEALQDRLPRGVSVQTTNDYLSALKSFGRWLVKDRRTADNPFAHLEGGNAQVDRRHDRRELTADELRRALDAARNSPASFRGLTGADRFHLYATACGTGFRASSLASLTPESFDLDAASPIVTLAARHAKNRKTKVQPLPADVAELLRGYLRDKPAGERVWGGKWASDRRGAEMLRIDLDAAGVPYVVEGPDGPLFADFHALRHTYLTLGGRAGIDLRTLQELAGHSTPVLTARYSHRRLYDLAGAIEKLPSFLPEDNSASALKATGTDSDVARRCTRVAQTSDIGRDGLRLVDATTRGGAGNDSGHKPLEITEFEAGCERLIPHEIRAGDGARTHDSHVGNVALYH